ncbi:uncharacterized protein [Physcomitrium patens]|uniref:Mitochondrial carrier protein n=1 Tax=Physcomitrium patens TaxID=3218 RepID=A0A2K1J3B1_PHYPA|nr:S-adenosylmethionine mitochondrial carrier protein-like isoform X2 [Physcomitrium patens]PNR36019.1 hypothetical protein PHYPA_021869 [Physcomitrium patens]|eukprot:XP_024399995.1 S-adenosylmethionine mitochondrial carrier protein-like isoform X2 [Physcomitrella patens]
MRHDLKSPIVAAVSGTLAVNILPSGMRCGVETGMVRDQAGSARNGSAVAVSSSSSSHWVDNLVAGGTASLCSKLVLQPLDIAKTILQASAEVRGSYSNLAQCLAGIVRDGGIPKLYTGFIASVAVSAPSSAVFVACYECSKNAIERASSSFPAPFQTLEDFVPLLAAAVGNVAASVVRVPPEVIKQRVQAGIYRDIFQATRAVWATEGLPGFYCGYSMQVARDIPYSALQFMTFEYLKKRYSHRENLHMDQKNSKRLVHDLCIGALAGAVACTLTTPLDVAKTRVMTQNPSDPLVYMGLQATLQKIWLEEGIAGFGRGMVPRVLYKVPASAVFLVCYEAIKRFLVTTRKVRPIRLASRKELGVYRGPRRV